MLYYLSIVLLRDALSVFTFQWNLKLRLDLVGGSCIFFIHHFFPSPTLPLGSAIWFPGKLGTLSLLGDMFFELRIRLPNKYWFLYENLELRIRIEMKTEQYWTYGLHKLQKEKYIMLLI